MRPARSSSRRTAAELGFSPSVFRSRVLVFALVLIGAVVCRAGSTIAADLPRGFLPGSGEITLELNGRALTIRLPAEWSGPRIEVEPVEEITLRLERSTDGQVGSVLVSDLRPTPGPLNVRVGVTLERSSRAIPLRRSTSPGHRIAYLSWEGAGLDMARALWLPDGSRLFDLSRTDRDLRLDWSAESDDRTGAKRLRVVGPVAPGREVDVFSWDLEHHRLGLRGGPAASGLPSDVGSQSGWLVRGAVDSRRLTARLEEVSLRGASYVELGDGWQAGAGKAFKGPGRDWSRPNESFEEGLKPFVRTLGERGIATGLWVAPFGSSDEKAFEARPEVFVRDREGRAIGDPWLGPFVIDPTSPAGGEQLADLVRHLAAKEVRALRVGGLETVRQYWSRNRRWLAQRELDATGVLLLGLRHLRRAAQGVGMRLLGEGEALPVVVDRLDGFRPPWYPAVGTEILAQEEVAAATWLGHRLRGVDVECHPLSVPSEPEGAAGGELERRRRRARRNFASMTGRGVLVETGSRSIGAETAGPVSAGARILPLDAFSREAAPEAWCLLARGTPDGGPRAIVGAIDSSSLRVRHLRVVASELGFANTSPARRGLILFDVGRGEYMGRARGVVDIEVSPLEGRFIAVSRDMGRPSIVAAGESLLARLENVRRESWDGPRRRLRADLRSDVRELHLHCPLPFALESLQVGDRALDLSAFSWRVGEHLVILLPLQTVAAAEGAQLQLEFRERPVDAEAIAHGVQLIVREHVSERRAWLEWARARCGRGDSTLSAVYRNGRLLRVTCDDRLLDRTMVSPTTVSPSEVSPQDSSREVEYIVLPVFERPTDVLDPAERTSTAVRRRGGARVVWRPPSPRDRGLSGCAPLSVLPGVVPPAWDRSAFGARLLVRGENFQQGIGTVAPSRIEYALGGSYDRLECQVGIDDAARFRGRAVFRVLVDGEPRWVSPEVSGLDESALPLRVDLRGADRLTLVVDAVAGETTLALADWLDPQLSVMPLETLESLADVSPADGDPAEGDRNEDRPDEPASEEK